MKKRFLSILLALCIVLTLLPTTAAAAATTDYFSTEASVTFKNGYGKTTENLSVSWNDGWFEHDATTYIHDLAITSMALSGSAYVENEDGIPVSDSIKAALGEYGFEEIESHNYYNEEDTYSPTESDNDHVGYTFAFKEIDHYANGPTYLIAVVIKGTSGNEEWYSNFNIGTGDIHAGFKTAAEEVMDSLNEYLEANHFDTAAVKFLVTGHSRGAAVANLIAAELTTGAVLNKSAKAYESNVYGYTFATPTVSKLAKESGYGNIFNIVSGEDFVTRVPLSGWDYGHYGIDLLLPSKSYYANYCLDQYKESGYPAIYNKLSSTFSQLTGETYESFSGTQKVDKLVSDVLDLAPTTDEFYSTRHFLVKTSGGLTFGSAATTSQYFDLIAKSLVKQGMDSSIPYTLLGISLKGDFAPITNFFLDNHVLNHRLFSAHSMAGYYSWLSSCTAKELFGSCNTSTYATFKRLTIACPADVYIYNGSGTIAASVINEEIIVNTLAVNVKDGVKTIDLPNDQEYSIKIVATDKGNVSYTIEEMAAEGSGNSVLRNVIFHNIDINTDDELTGKVNDILYTDKNNYALTKNNTGKIYADYDSYNPSSNPNPADPPDTWSNPFSDVDESAWFYDAVKFANQNGLMDGAGNGKFTPNANLSRAMLAQILYNKEGRPTVTDASSFSDVRAGAWYADAVTWAAANNIVGGYGNGLFGPGDDITREQFAVILYRYAGSPVPPNLLLDFTDADKVSDWAQDAVRWAVDQGIFKGKGNGTLDPTGKATRAEAAQMLKNYFGQ